MFTLENRKSYNNRKSLVKKMEELKREVEMVRKWNKQYGDELAQLRDGIYPKYEYELKNRKEEITNLQRRVKNLNDVIKSEGIIVRTKSDTLAEDIVKQGKIIADRNKTIKELKSEIEQLKKPQIQDVHTRHCCGEHKQCKYGNLHGECTVCNDPSTAERSCNCEHY